MISILATNVIVYNIGQKSSWNINCWVADTNKKESTTMPVPLKNDMITKPLHTLDHIRKSFNGATSRADRSEIGQFLTPVAIAQFMSSMFETGPQQVRILDPGAGAGVLFATCVETLISQVNRPLSIEVVAYETDSTILPYLEDTLKKCQSLCISNDIEFHGIIKAEDFVSAAIAEMNGSLFLAPGNRFTHVILNPPYKKINSQTAMSRMLYSSGIEVANLYAVFVWLSMSLVGTRRPNGRDNTQEFLQRPVFQEVSCCLLAHDEPETDSHIRIAQEGVRGRQRAAREHHLSCCPGASETEVCLNLRVRGP